MRRSTEDPRLTGRRARSALATVAAVVAVVATACGGAGSSDSGDRSVAPATRPDTGPITAAPTTKPPPDQAKRRSEPYWVPVADFKGTGPTTTSPFTIDANALQWRGTYHCQTAPFSAIPIDAGGQPAKRHLADAAACGAEGKGFASAPGSYTLKITTAGTWDIKIEQQIDTPLVEPLVATATDIQPLVTTKVYGVDREGEGTLKLFRMPDGSALIRLEDFYVTLNSDLEVRLSPLENPRTTDEIAAAPFVAVAPLKATVGSMNYPVPPNIDLAGYHSVIIWCEITRNAYAAASLAQG